jgi:hypothetical protein
LVLAWDVQNPMQHGDGQRSARLRIFPDGRMLVLPNGRNLRESKIAPEKLAELLTWLVEDRKVPEWTPQKIQFRGRELEPEAATGGGSASTDILKFNRDGKKYGIVVSGGRELPEDTRFKEIRERLWKLGDEAKPGGN